MSTRAARSTRALIAAAVATLIAALSHVAGGGQAPGALTFAVALALSSVVCIALSSRTLSLWRLTASVAFSQAAFHSLFAVLGDRVLVAESPAGHGSVSMTDHLPMTDHVGATMWAAHLAAALVTVAALHRGERVLLALVDLLLLRLSGRTPAVVIPPRRRLAAAYASPLASGPRRSAVGSLRRRGPPLTV